MKFIISFLMFLPMLLSAAVIHPILIGQGEPVPTSWGKANTNFANLNLAIAEAQLGWIAGIDSSIQLANTNANSVYVSKSGNDTTGRRGQRDKSFLTIGAAKTNALAGDTIIVSPGAYNETDLLKRGVNYFFDAGAVVRYTGTSTRAVFDDWAGATTNVIAGSGEFYNYTTTTNATAYLATILITNHATWMSASGHKLGGSFTNIATASVLQIVDAGHPSPPFDVPTFTFDRIELTGNGNPGMSGYSAIGMRGYSYASIHAHEIYSYGKGITWTRDGVYDSGSIWVSCEFLYSAYENIDFRASEDTTKLWVNTREMYSSYGGNIVATNRGRLYVTAQKMSTDGNIVTNIIIKDWVNLWLEVDKLTSGTGPNLSLSGGNTYARIKQIEASVSSSAGYPAAYISGGTNFLSVDTLTSTRQNGYTVSGGDTTLDLGRIQVSSTNTAINVSAGTVNVQGGSISGATNIHVSGSGTTRGYYLSNDVFHASGINWP